MTHQAGPADEDEQEQAPENDADGHPTSARLCTEETPHQGEADDEDQERCKTLALTPARPDDGEARAAQDVAFIGGLHTNVGLLSTRRA